MFFHVFRLIVQCAIDVLTSFFDVFSSIPNVFLYFDICISWMFLQGNKVIADNIFLGHLWYLSEVLIALKKFDTRVSFDEKKANA